MPPDRRFPFQGPRPCNSKGSPAMPQTSSHGPQMHNTVHSAPPTAAKPTGGSAENNPLRALLQKTDGDTLLILALLLLLAKEKKDRRLLLALGYIML